MVRRWLDPLVAAAVALAVSGSPALAQKQRFNWDAIGVAYCQFALAGDLRGVRALLTPSLARAIENTLARTDQRVSPTLLLQSYSNPAPSCTTRTRNVALVEITRSGLGGAAPAWTEYLVIVPQPDGSNRIDDVLFATRRSDTLRARLNRLGAATQ